MSDTQLNDAFALGHRINQVQRVPVSMRGWASSVGTGSEINPTQDGVLWLLASGGTLPISLASTSASDTSAVTLDVKFLDGDLSVQTVPITMNGLADVLVDADARAILSMEVTTRAGDNTPPTGTISASNAFDGSGNPTGVIFSKMQPATGMAPRVFHSAASGAFFPTSLYCQSTSPCFLRLYRCELIGSASFETLLLTTIVVVGGGHGAARGYGGSKGRGCVGNSRRRCRCGM